MIDRGRGWRMIGIAAVMVCVTSVCLVTSPLPAAASGMAPGNIYTIAGLKSGGGQLCGDGAPAAQACLNLAGGDSGPTLAFDKNGNVIFADAANNEIRLLARGTTSPLTPTLNPLTAGDIYNVAGNGSPPTGNGDGGPARSATIAEPGGVVSDAAGNLLVADQAGCEVRLVAGAASDPILAGHTLTPGNIYAVAGNGGCGAPQTGVPALSTDIGQPYGVALDRSGNLVISEPGNQLVQIDAAKTADSLLPGQALSAGDLYTVAGGGCCSSTNGDGGRAVAASLYEPMPVAGDPAGNLLIGDDGEGAVRLVAAASSDPFAPGQTLTPGDIYSIAGNNAQPGATANGIPATQADLAEPRGLALDQAGNLLVVDSSRNTVRLIAGTASDQLLSGVLTPGDIYTPIGILTEVGGYSGDGAAASAAHLDYPTGLAADTAGVYVLDSYNNTVREVFDPTLFATSASLALSSNPAPLGGALKLTATVSNTTTAAPPAGTVTFFDGPSALGNGSETSAGNQLTATLSTSSLKLGGHSITAKFSDSTGKFLPSQTQAAAVTIQRAITTTSLAVTKGSNPSNYGLPVTWTASVSSTSAWPVKPSGRVTFWDGTPKTGRDLGALALSSGGKASLTPRLHAGMHTIFAVYQGDANYVGSQLSLKQTVKPEALSVQAQNQTVTYGSKLPPLTFSANFVAGDTAKSLVTQPVCATTALTDKNGDVSSPAATYPISCHGAQSHDYGPITYHQGVLRVSRAASQLVYQGSPSVASLSDLHVKARLTSGTGAAIAMRQVKFTLNAAGAAHAETCTGTTNVQGIAVCVIPKVQKFTGKRPLIVTFPGDSPGQRYDYLSSAVRAVIQEK